MKKMKRRAAENGTTITNPIQLLTSFKPLAETSIVNQTQTKMALNTSGIISGLSHGFQTINKTSFNVIVTVALYAPGHPGDISVYDFTGSQPDGSPSQKRPYVKIFQSKFGKGYRLAQFVITDIPPIDGSQTIVVTHPPCKRRCVLADQVVNLTSPSVDTQTIKFNKTQGENDIVSGSTETTSQDFEMCYGTVAIGGAFNQFIGPSDYLPINNVGTKIDDFDLTVKTFYKLTSATNSFRLNATANFGKFDWAASVVTFKALTL